MKPLTKNYKKIIAIAMVLNLTSCSWMNNRKVLFGDKGDKKETLTQEVKSNVVPKTQYDQLLTKYETLLDKVKHAEMKSASDMDKSIQHHANSGQNKMISELSKITPPADLAETVDVFGGSVAKPSIDNDILAVSATVSNVDIQKQLNSLQKANRLVNENRIDSALILLKDLEDSPNKQIKVRAKYYLAEMLFRQSEFDLAMQMYEEIINNYAFSGLVIKSLGRLIVCSDKLKLNKKKEMYYSTLHELFGV